MAKCELCKGSGWRIIERDGAEIAQPCACRTQQKPRTVAAIATNKQPMPDIPQGPQTLKHQAAAYRKSFWAFKQYERAARDLLLLCLPRATVEKHLDALREIRGWFEERHFTHDRRDYPFEPDVFKAAVETLWNSGFQPNGKSDPTQVMNYVKKTMITILETDTKAANKRAAARQAQSIGQVLAQLAQQA